MTTVEKETIVNNEEKKDSPVTSSPSPLPTKPVYQPTETEWKTLINGVVTIRTILVFFLILWVAEFGYNAYKSAEYENCVKRCSEGKNKFEAMSCPLSCKK